jgi:23S rRNA (guanosine2251-2'-O)-methyltransferase
MATRRTRLAGRRYPQADTPADEAGRDEPHGGTGTDLVYGRNAVMEALRSARAQEVILAAGSTGAAAGIQKLAIERGTRVTIWDRRELDRLAPGLNHQGTLARVSPFPYSQIDDLLASAQAAGEPPLLLILDCIQDPQNLGTLLRTAEVVGAHGVIIPRHRSAEVTPAVEKASAGAVEHLRVAMVTNLTQTIGRLKEAGVWVVGVENATGATDYSRADLAGPLALVVGSEGRGVSRLVRESCDFLVRLPVRGKLGSLNAAVAGSIVLYEALRQRSQV